MLNEREGTYPKKNSGMPKEEVPKKKQEHQHGEIIELEIKQEMETIQRPIKEINQNGKIKPGLDYAGVTPLSSRDRA